MAPEANASLKKLMAVGSFLLGKRFNSSRCKTELKLSIARMKLLKNRREAQIRLMRRDIAALLGSGQDSTARIRVEHVIREQNIMAANEIIQLFCELLVVRLPIIAKQRECPADLKEAISSLLFSGPRCSEIPELLRIRDIFEKKYGKDFVSAAIELRPDSGVNRMLIEKLSVRTPPGEVKLKVMKEIAKEFQVEWDTKESEEELLKLPEERLNGPSTFVDASSVPMKLDIPAYWNEPRSCEEATSTSQKEDIKDSISAAKAAVELAEKAVAVAQAAAHLAHQSSTNITDHNVEREAVIDKGVTRTSTSVEPVVTGNRSCRSSLLIENARDYQESERTLNDEDASMNHQRDMKKRYSERSVNSDIKFDDSDEHESDCSDEVEEHSCEKQVNHPPPERPAPKLLPSYGATDADMNKANISSSRVHPKLPDYDSLAARFEALRLRRFS